MFQGVSPCVYPPFFLPVLSVVEAPMGECQDECRNSEEGEQCNQSVETEDFSEFQAGHSRASPKNSEDDHFDDEQCGRTRRQIAFLRGSHSIMGQSPNGHRGI
jgi:hypothetical protein